MAPPMAYTVQALALLELAELAWRRRQVRPQSRPVRLSVADVLAEWTAHDHLDVAAKMILPQPPTTRHAVRSYYPQTTTMWGAEDAPARFGRAPTCPACVTALRAEGLARAICTASDAPGAWWQR